MRQVTITIRPGSGEASGSWLWYLDRGADQWAHGVESSLQEAADAATASLAFFLSPEEWAAAR